MHDKMTLREWLPLLGLTFAAFIFNTSEFMPIGLLTDIAADLAVTEAQAGIIITAYAWAVMILSLPLMMLASRFGFRRLLLVVIAVFAVGQVLSVVSTGFAMLMASRIVVACAHSVFWSIASPMAVRVVSERHHALALSMIVTGTSVAMILGLPLGRIVGLWVGWRMAFMCVAVASGIALAYLAVVFPKMPAGEPFTLQKLPGLFRNPGLVGTFVFIGVMITGYYTGYSYIEPFMQQMAGMSDESITLALTIFGVAGILGSLLYARLFDGHRTAFITTAVVGLTLALFLLAPSAMVGPVAVVLVCLLWGLSATSFNVALQGEAIGACSQDESAVAMSIYSGIFNLGIGGGTALGGLVVTHASIGVIGYVGGGIAAVASAFCISWLLPRLHGSGKRAS